MNYIIQIDCFSFHVSNARYCEYDGFLYNVDKIMDRDIKLDWDDLPSADMYSELLEEKVIQLLN